MYNGKTCNGSGYSKGAQLVGSMNGCQSSVSGYAGVYDLSGNVEEWEDSCDANSCRLRGGSFSSISSDTLCCDASDNASRDTSLNYYGFRCCAD